MSQTTSERFAEERSRRLSEHAARKAERLAADRDRHRGRQRVERARVNAGITWLDPPVVFGRHGRCRVVGVCNDAPDATKEYYGIAVAPQVASPDSLQGLADRSQRRRTQARALARVS